MEGPTGNIIPATVSTGHVNRATIHATASEYWHVLSGRVETRRRDESGEEVAVLEPDVSIDIPVGTAFQYRRAGAEPLRLLCIEMPPWPGNSEPTLLDRPWVPTAPSPCRHSWLAVTAARRLRGRSMSRLE
jgi:mannose-6-phosphate isomerase-like protein (cupin superfamily)